MGRRDLLILTRLIGDDAVFLNAEEKTQFPVSQELEVSRRSVPTVSRNNGRAKAPQEHFPDHLLEILIFGLARLLIVDAEIDWQAYSFDISAEKGDQTDAFHRPVVLT
jgi:hypothetical protein